MMGGGGRGVKRAAINERKSGICVCTYVVVVEGGREGSRQTGDDVSVEHRYSQQGMCLPWQPVHPPGGADAW